MLRFPGFICVNFLVSTLFECAGPRQQVGYWRFRFCHKKKCVQREEACVNLAAETDSEDNLSEEDVLCSLLHGAADEIILEPKRMGW
mmetsp:Transcript_39025/g.82062  ORF Transcript_39025/g.82062 Transcript_39025/m.82062 type:complete len:87 (+) Transcript_39025:684-944(+)